jgi:hypothetical protein
MLKLIVAVIFLLTISFASGYGVRDWMSRRRRKEVRKKFYQRYRPDALAPKTETATGASRRELTIRELQAQLSQLENRIADAILEIEAFRDEARSEFFATRELLERKFEEPRHSNDGGRVPAPQTTD